MLTGKTVLIAEDDAAMRFFVAGILRQLNCEGVIQCVNGTDAINELTSSSKNLIDLILCDWEMPGATGDEILLHLRGDEEITHIPFIMTTSRSDKDSLVKVSKLGINDYLVKPFSAADLIERIDSVMHPKKPKHPGSGKSAGGQKVNITFSQGSTYEGKLTIVSQTECAALVPLFKHGIQGLYDEADLIIQK
ncbi:MAG: response regulator, partial [Thermodesulfobacteriota bacterium]